MASRESLFIIIAILVLASIVVVESFVVQSNSRVNTRLEYRASSEPKLSPQHQTQVERSVVQQEQATSTTTETRKKRSTRRTSRHGSQEAIEVLTMKDFHREVLDEKEKLVVVRFFAPWCRACSAIAPYYSKFTKEVTTKQESTSNRIKFVDCPQKSATSNEIQEALGIHTIPFAHVYHPNMGLVEERYLTRKQYMSFERTTKTYLKGECELKNDDAMIDPHPNAMSHQQQQQVTKST